MLLFLGCKGTYLSLTLQKSQPFSKKILNLAEFFSIFLILWKGYFIRTRLLQGSLHPLSSPSPRLTCMWLGCLAKFRLRDSLCQLYYIGSMDAEEDDQNFRLLDSAVYSLQPVMFLLCPKAWCDGVASHRPCCHGQHQDILSSYDGCPVYGLPRTSSDTPFLYIPTAAWHRSGMPQNIW